MAHIYISGENWLLLCLMDFDERYIRQKPITREFKYATPNWDKKLLNVVINSEKFNFDALHEKPPPRHIWPDYYPQVEQGFHILGGAFSHRSS